MNEIVQATHRAPVKLGPDLSVDGLVLPDGEAVLTTRGIMGILAGRNKGDLGAYIDALPAELKPDLAGRKREFRTPDGRAVFHGYTALTLITICQAYVAAKAAKKLHHKQVHLADRAQAILNALAGIGLIALIYEQVGYVKFEKPAPTPVFVAPISVPTFVSPPTPMIGPHGAEMYVNRHLEHAAREISGRTGDAYGSVLSRLKCSLRNALGYVEGGSRLEFWPNSPEAVSKLNIVRDRIVNAAMKEAKQKFPQKKNGEISIFETIESGT